MEFLGSSRLQVGLSLLVAPQDRVLPSLIFPERCTGLSPPLRPARLGRQHLLQGPVTGYEAVVLSGRDPQAWRTGRRRRVIRHGHWLMLGAWRR
jgi:hypothetical protein